MRDQMSHGRRTQDDDGDSTISFDSLGPSKAPGKHVWSDKGGDKVNYDTFHRMQDEYREAKRREGQLDLKAKQLAAQLSRTEEAAKRALVQTDVTAKGGAAQKLLDAERALYKMRDENVELRGKLARANKRANDFKVAHDENKKRLETALKDQRLMARKVGELERKTIPKSDDYWSEEAGRRNRLQQEELVVLREENMKLRKQVAQGGAPGGSAAGASGSNTVSEEVALAAAAQIEELNGLVRFYESKVSAMAKRQAQAFGGGSGGGGPNPDDWVLEDLGHGGSLYLVDPKTSKLFTVPSGNDGYPRPVGMRVSGGVKLGSNSRMDRFICELDRYCQTGEQRLEDVFRSFDTSGDGLLDRNELARILLQLMPEMDAGQVDVVRCLMDLDGDGQVSFAELVQAIKEAYGARNAAKTGRSVEINDVLRNVRSALQNQRSLVKEEFDALDKDRDGCLHHLDVVRLVRLFCQGLSQREVRYLLMKIMEWDLAGEGKATLNDLYQALELPHVYRASQANKAGGSGGGNSRGTAARSTDFTAYGGGMGGSLQGTPSKSYGAARTAGGAGMMTSPGHTASPHQAGGAAAQAQRDAQMKDRLAQLEADLDQAHTREGVLEADAKRADVMRRDLALAKARIEDMEKDYMKLDLLSHMSEQGGEDSKLKTAWETASLFKKRYMEHKGELDTIRLGAARMQSQLEETHKLLHEEHRKRFKLEDDNTRLGMEAARIKDVQALLSKERSERQKLEREFMELQNKALLAPGQALGEVRQLRDEVFALRRDKAKAEAKEGEVRRELSDVRQQLDGMSADQYKSAGQLKKQIAELQLEVTAAHKKLEVYRQAGEEATRMSSIPEPVVVVQEAPRLPDPEPSMPVHQPDITQALFSYDRRPDVNKSDDELRHELMQLRDVWNADQLELKKLHKVLAVESGQTLEAKAGLEETHREMDRLRRDLADQMHGMKRELDRRDEKIRKLELQLRGAYSGVNRALRSSTLRESRTTSSPDDLSELGLNQNILELHISEAMLQEDVLGPDPSTFFTFDFFMHDTQATPVVASSKPQYDTLVQYVVDNDTFLLEYLDSHVLELELNRARGWDYDAVGVARLSLRQILEDMEVGAAMGKMRAYHHADVHGADGQKVGRVRYGFNFRRPLDSMLREFRAQAPSQRASQPDPRDPVATAVALAMSDPKSASHVKAIITRCEQLVLPGGGPPARPYVWYRFPGHGEAHSTRIEHGANPTFCDEALWLTSRTPSMEASLRTRELEVVVFDDAGGEDPMRSIVGVARVPMDALAQGVPVEGAFGLTHPISRQPAGAVILGMGWANPLAQGPYGGLGGVGSGTVNAIGSGGAGPALLHAPNEGTVARIADQADPGLAGFEGEELREVGRVQRPPMMSGYTPQPTAAAFIRPVSNFNDPHGSMMHGGNRVYEAQESYKGGMPPQWQQQSQQQQQQQPQPRPGSYSLFDQVQNLSAQPTQPQQHMQQPHMQQQQQRFAPAPPPASNTPSIHQMQQPSFPRGLQQQPLPPAYNTGASDGLGLYGAPTAMSAGQGSVPSGGNVHGAAIPPRVPSNRFGDVSGAGGVSSGLSSVGLGLGLQQGGSASMQPPPSLQQQQQQAYSAGQTYGLGLTSSATPASMQQRQPQPQAQQHRGLSAPSYGVMPGMSSPSQYGLGAAAGGSVLMPQGVNRMDVSGGAAPRGRYAGAESPMPSSNPYSTSLAPPNPRPPQQQHGLFM